MKHRIELTNTIPFKERHRRIQPAMVEEDRKHLEDVVAGGVVRISPLGHQLLFCVERKMKSYACALIIVGYI